MSKKFYWLKLKEDFFNDPDIKLIKAQKDGKDFLILYLQLQLLSLRNEGILRHKDVIPYTPDMLSTLTDTPKSIVEQGIKLFVNLGMIEQWDDGTLYMLEMQKLIGHESESAARVRKHREQEKQKMLQCNEEVTKSNTEIELEKEIELDIEKKKDKKPTQKQVFSNIIMSYTQTPSLIEAIENFVDMRKSIKAKLTEHALKLMLGKLSKMSSNEQEQIEILNQSIMNSWKGIFPLTNKPRQVADFDVDTSAMEEFMRME